ncbi:MAG: SMC family ATPase [Erysipelotrichaceae bacterium]
MRPIKLEISAFGSFVNRQVIDFTKLNENGLFLIHGQTGSGKTFIFDAICFALYGEMSGDYRKVSDARCQFANEKEKTIVSFTFDINGHLYQVNRVGSMRKTNNEKSIIFECNLLDIDKNEVISDKIMGCNSEIVSLIGLNATQFKQVVILPQNKFLDILNAKSSEREELLTTLLATGHYKDISDFLLEKAKKLENSINGLYEDITDYTSKYALPEAFDEALIQLEKNRDYASKILETNKQMKDKLLKELEIKTNELNGAIFHNQQLQEFENVSKDYHTLTDKKQEIDDLRIFVSQLKVSKEINATYESLTSSRNEKEIVVNNLNKLYSEYEHVKDEYQKINYLKEEKEQLKNQIDYENRKLEELNSISTLIDQHDDNNKRLHQLENDKQINNELLINNELSLNSNNEHKEQLKKLLEDIDIKIGKFQELVKNNDDNKDIIEDIKSKNTLMNERKDLVKAINRYEEQLNMKSNEYIKIEKTLSTYDNIDDYVVLDSLGSTLRDDIPCPLCGSYNHPNIYHLPQDKIDSKSVYETYKTAFNNLSIDIEGLRRNLELCSNDLVIKNDRIEEINGKLIGFDCDQILMESENSSFNTQQLTSLINNRQEKGKELQNISDKINELMSQKNDLNIKYIQINDGINEMIKNNEILFTKLSNHGFTIESFKNDYHEFIRQNDEKKEQLKQLENRIENILVRHQELSSSINVNDENLTKLDAKIVELDKEFSLVLNDNNFAFDLFMGLRKRVEEIPALEIQINQFDNSYGQTSGIYHNLKEKIKNDQYFDIEGITTNLNELKYRRSMMDNRILELNNTFVQTSDDYLHLTDLVSEYQKIEKDYVLVKELSGISNGNAAGIHKVSLQKYVMASKLDEILAISSNYMMKFTNNRYSLHRKQLADKLNNRGLDIIVYDSFSDDNRSIASLSGGESFLASLSLAIATSDVVQSKKGGVNINTIFIDEGFGSLDSNSVELAIDALVMLQESGKLIGVISHVEELVNRIDNKIKVVKSNYGSNIVIE